MFCISESINTNISHQLFDYKITFVNSQNTNLKGDFVLKTRFEPIDFKDFGYTKINLSSNYTLFYYEKNHSDINHILRCL
jgi:phosphatidylinositol kinase/protein kinase (PI-3  family)